MTTGALFTCKPDDSVDSALETLVQQRITGLPVVDGSNVVVSPAAAGGTLAPHFAGRRTRAWWAPSARTWCRCCSLSLSQDHSSSLSPAARQPRGMKRGARAQASPLRVFAAHCALEQSVVQTPLTAAARPPPAETTEYFYKVAMSF